MDPTAAPDPYRTASPAQARELLRPELRRLLDLLMAAERSVSEVAHLLRAQYLTRRLEQLGMAQVTSVQPRAGRAVRRDRVAGRWFTPSGPPAPRR
jgi:hypothetical protein